MYKQKEHFKLTAVGIIVIALIFVSAFTVNAFADTAKGLTFEEAKAYLENYSETRTNQYGKQYTTEYEFASEEDLNSFAMYIAENGIDAFNEMIDNELKKELASQPKHTQSRTTQPSTVRRTIKGDGKHTVSARTYGLVEFDKCGNYEYEIELGYTITVKNGKMTQLNDISFTNPYIFPKDGKIDNERFPSHCEDTHAGVTANYTVTGYIYLNTPAGDIALKSESKTNIFTLLTYLE